MLEKTIPSLKTGNESFSINDTSLNISLLDFWRWSVSDLLSNASRGILAEFIVASALGIDTNQVRDEWQAHDLTTDDGIKIEVKSAAYIQSWAQKDYSKISFSIKESHTWESETNILSQASQRQSDVYVFALLHHKDQSTIDPLKLEQWTFYVVPTSKLNEYFGQQKTVSLKMIERLPISALRYSQIKESVRSSPTMQVL